MTFVIGVHNYFINHIKRVIHGEKYYILQLYIMGGGNKHAMLCPLFFFLQSAFLQRECRINDGLKNSILICFHVSLAFGIIAAAQQVCDGVCCSWGSAKVAGDSSSFHGSHRSLHVLILFVLQPRCHGKGKTFF